MPQLTPEYPNYLQKLPFAVVDVVGQVNADWPVSDVQLETVVGPRTQLQVTLLVVEREECNVDLDPRKHNSGLLYVGCIINSSSRKWKLNSCPRDFLRIHINLLWHRLLKVYKVTAITAMTLWILFCTQHIGTTGQNIGNNMEFRVKRKPFKLIGIVVFQQGYSGVVCRTSFLDCLFFFWK